MPRGSLGQRFAEPGRPHQLPIPLRQRCWPRILSPDFRPLGRPTGTLAIHPAARGLRDVADLSRSIRLVVDTLHRQLRFHQTSLSALQVTERSSARGARIGSVSAFRFASATDAAAQPRRCSSAAMGRTRDAPLNVNGAWAVAAPACSCAAAAALGGCSATVGASWPLLRGPLMMPHDPWTLLTLARAHRPCPRRAAVQEARGRAVHRRADPGDPQSALRRHDGRPALAAARTRRLLPSHAGYHEPLHR